MGKKLLRLAWVDSQGEPYHEATFSPRDAREQLKRDGIAVVRFPVGAVALRNLTYKAVSESSRGVVADRPNGGTVIITLESDN